jgi:uncharacterized repeat protein (TIGR03803 family)
MKSSFGKWACVLLMCSAIAVSVSTAQTLKSVFTFNGNLGANPHSPLIIGTDGNFYGTTYYGGVSNYGTVFKVTPGGTLTSMHSFGNFDGARPYAGLIQATDGNFYGTTSLGGTLGGGTVFKLTPTGAFTLLYSFGGSGGTIPYGGLVQGTDGNLYGTTYQGGLNGRGTVFQLTLSGALTTIYNFAGPDGGSIYAGLTLGSDGNFYGTTYQGGANNDGTVFQITPTGTLTTLYNFAGTDGNQPYSPLIQGSDGNFYGTTFLGGANGNGTVYQLTPTGTLTTLHSFCSPTNCTDGSNPYAALTQAADGSFYGAASTGGHFANGTVFNITSTGTFTTVYAFGGADGHHPYAGVVVAPGGNLYGTTYSGGTGNAGTVFSMSPNPYQFVPVTPCRLVDTRTSAPIAGGTTQGFNLKQLAQANGCNDLTAASIYSLNVTLIPVSGPVSYITIWPTGETQPSVSLMNSYDGRVKANAAIVPEGTDGSVNIFVTNTANVLVDINGYFGAPGTGTLAFYALTPCRVADTRGPDGNLGGPFLQGGQERDFPLLSSTCLIPPNAKAYSLNFTAIPYSGQSLGYLTVWADGQPQPVVSTLNNPTATVVPNAAIVPAGNGGAIAVYPSGNTNLAIDINGYFATPESGGLSLYPAVPCRAIDTRSIGSGAPFTGALTPPVDVVDGPCAIPSTAQAYVFNATVIPAPTLGFLTLWPDGKAQPVVSTLNASDGFTASNMAVVPNTNGKTDAFAQGTTQLILDISSYFAP